MDEVHAKAVSRDNVNMALVISIQLELSQKLENYHHALMFRPFHQAVFGAPASKVTEPGALSSHLPLHLITHIHRSHSTERVLTNISANFNM